MSDSHIEPQRVIELVESYVAEELRDAEKYTNRTPLDESGVWSLHQLAREVYALGVKDGCTQESLRESRRHTRERETARKKQSDKEN